MKLDDNKGDPNSLLIPRDVGARKIKHHSGGDNKNMSGGSTLAEACKTIEEEKKKPSLKTASGEDKEAEKQRIIEEARIKEEENRKIMELRNRARDLQDQIRWWQNQRGQGSHDDNTINGMVSTLQSQLGGIDGKYW